MLNEQLAWDTPWFRRARRIDDELYARLRGVQRAVLMRAGELPGEEAHALQQLCDSLPMGRME